MINSLSQSCVSEGIRISGGLPTGFFYPAMRRTNRYNHTMDKPVRKHMRLHEYDYSTSTAYFVTICAYRHQCLFGSYDDHSITLSNVGTVADITWKNLRGFFNIELDDYVIMPNHLHGILTINSETTTTDQIKSPTLISIVQTFKSLTTKRVHALGFSGQIWQRSYYDRIIRDEDHLNAARDYIRNNPLGWELDSDFKLIETIVG